MWRFCEDIKSISIKLCKVVVVWVFLQTGSYAKQATNLKYSLSGNGLNLYFGERGKLKLGADLEGGVVRDGALYSSFGLEAQIYHLSKLVINLDGEINSSDREQWLFKLDLAPLYNSIEFKDPFKHINIKKTMWSTRSFTEKIVMVIRSMVQTFTMIGIKT